MTPSKIADAAWIATRSKALLTATDTAKLTTMRSVYSGAMNNDPHMVATINALLAP